MAKPPLDRRAFLRLGAAVAAAGPVLPALAATGTTLGRSRPRGTEPSRGSPGDAPGTRPASRRRREVEIEEATIAELQSAMASGRFGARHLVEMYLERIGTLDTRGPHLRSVLEVNPAALEDAASLDVERRERGPRGPLHGIPVLLKDNLDTADRMTTTAGSLALSGSIASRDSHVARKLREAGAVFLGKANMSEWANFRSSRSSSGWSSRGGQCRNPYALDRSPCGSSSGSAVAVAANLSAVAVGTETDGSIICPAAATALVGIKPTVGRVSRAGIIPIAHSQDTAGPLARTVADAALLMAVMAGPDPRDPASTTARGRAAVSGYGSFLDPQGLRGARIGVARAVYFGYSEETDAVVEEALEAMRQAGATLVDPADIPTAEAIARGDSELEVLLYEFKWDLDAYLASLGPGAPVHSLAEVIDFNERNAEHVMPWFGQDLLLRSLEKGPLSEKAYREALATIRRSSRREGLDAVLERLRLDALVAPSGSPPFKIDLINGDHFLGGSSSPCAMAGYPAVTVPAGSVRGLPVGITFMGRAWAESTLIRLAYAFEQMVRARRSPSFPSTVDPQAADGG